MESQETPEANDHKISRRQIPNYNNNRPVFGQNGVPEQNGNNSGFFDDIFKVNEVETYFIFTRSRSLIMIHIIVSLTQIPVSTLNAVNQFLNNNTS